MEAITKKVVEIGKEQKRAERLLDKLLPKNVAIALKNGEVSTYIENIIIYVAKSFLVPQPVILCFFQKISESFDAATVMFCTISGFKELTKERTPLEVKTHACS